MTTLRAKVEGNMRGSPIEFSSSIQDVNKNSNKNYSPWNQKDLEKSYRLFPLWVTRMQNA